jgi:hypothetical protein
VFHWGGALIHNIWKVQDFLVKKNIQVPLSPDLFFLLPKLKQALVGLTLSLDKYFSSGTASEH